MLVELLDTALLWFANVPIPNRAQTPKNTIVEPLRDAREPRLETMVETDSPWSEPCCVEDPNWASALRGNGTGSSDMTCKAVGGRDMTGRPTLAARPAWRSTLHETRLEECSPGPRSERKLSIIPAGISSSNSSSSCSRVRDALCCLPYLDE